MIKRILIIFLVIIPVIFSANETDFGCSVGDGCNSKCPNGDKDCPCNLLNGDVCFEDETCNSVLLKNYDNVVCCSNECKKGINTKIINNIAYFTSENNQDNITVKNENVYYSNAKNNDKPKLLITLIGLTILLILAILLYIFDSKYKFFKKEDLTKNNIEKKPEIKKDAFLDDIIRKLTKDEARIVNLIIENGKLKQDEIMGNLGFTKEKLNSALLKLERRQIIKRKKHLFLFQAFSQYYF